ncbi:triacylglycerol lipase [Chlorella sorokiniana]|uniref:Triacylglycerol lipase n=1 Tax=Chlorella sorokiniana TaxID=3076 RepID=A0A2P6U165_CHLSO|nr:triacylglycerol lipase [Chlorella sorokiniana]|eukprot:PRW60048.1 triacylglycerol lipase [Chlorella sorokiniana]
MSDIQTAEGLGGSNVSPDDPRVRSEPPSGNQPRPTDPEWVDRKDPGSLPKHLPNVGEGVAYDPASNKVVGMGGGTAEGQGGGASTTAALGAGHALGEAGSAEDRGVRGTDAQR